ncbi:flavoprotein [Caloranaerobacter ferrireducens]|uniref:flavoprotein n=1 Tax=Caloranaerobacter ferrireducens TaxID=1323370 RepID=UPI00084DB6B3|nr:flavoprotein [Caloranaerobacter ferrireducens]
MDKYEFTKSVINELFKKTSNIYEDRKDETEKNFIETNSVHLALVFTGTNIGLNDYVDKLIKLKRYGFTYDVVLSEVAEEIIGMDVLKSRLGPKKIFNNVMIANLDVFYKFDGVIVPMMTQNTLTKLVMGLQDDFITSLIWHMLWFSKPVFIDFLNCRTKMGSKAKNPFLDEMIEGYLDKLIKMGVTEVDKKDFVVKILDKFKTYKSFESLKTQTNEDKMTDVNFFEGVITEKDVISIAKKEKEIIVSARTIITPLAKDTAKELGLKIRKK